MTMGKKVKRKTTAILAVISKPNQRTNTGTRRHGWDRIERRDVGIERDINDPKARHDESQGDAEDRRQARDRRTAR